MKQKYAEKPVAVINVMRPDKPNMGTYLTQWFIFILFVSFLIAYIAAHSMPLGARYLDVFRVVGAIGFLTYGAGQIPESIWWGRPWKVTLKEMLDGLVYGLMTAGTFGWLWPR